jgi:hypothetical protein
LAEHKLPKLGVAGSSPVARSTDLRVNSPAPSCRQGWNRLQPYTGCLNGVRESGLCPLFLLPFAQEIWGAEKEDNL